MASYDFATYGPYNLERRGGITLKDFATFTDTVCEDSPDLLSAVGVYIFAVRSTKTSALKPWYVGKTDKSFLQRLRTHRRSGKIFADIAAQAPNGSLNVLLIPRLTPTGRFQKAAQRSINALEDVMIGSCLQLNPKLSNVRKTDFIRNLRVPGYVNSGRIYSNQSGALALREMLGYKA